MQFSYSDGLFVPQRSPKERPKSEILCVRWADETDILEVVRSFIHCLIKSTETLVKRKKKFNCASRIHSKNGGHLGHTTTTLAAILKNLYDYFQCGIYYAVLQSLLLYFGDCYSQI